MGMTTIKISTPDGSSLCEGAFARGSMLALVAGEGRSPGDPFRFVLTPDPAVHALAYAVFAIESKTVNAISARSDVLFGSGRRAAIRREAKFYIGSRDFVVQVERNRLGLRRLCGRRAAVVVAAAAIAASIGVVRMVATGVGGADSERVEASEVIPSIETVPEADDLSKEVAAFMRSGRRGQARLAILEHIERYGSDERTREMLASLASHRDEPAGLRADRGGARVDVLARARALYEEGVERMKGGELPEALSRFRKSNELLSSISAEMPLNGLLAEAISSSTRRFKAGIESRLAGLRKMADDVANDDPRRASARLAEGYEACREMARVIPDDGEVRSLLRGLEAALAGQARRWMESAKAMELYSGCEAAAIEFREMMDLLGDLLPGLAREAKEGVARCGGRS